ncbi:hypothetical protein BLNAU_10720 [Blattamonas nauphoetae]|uniref:Uncharacterized protein n=1 Tax=Blattamonas nauphoetae TaxID=2049346 RepID=A0ABQ9XPP3_9EUKA|nr:hypothetical protein BLNAU_10720 [Blattamonas nauphoetae]
MKSQPALDVSLEAKAVKFLKSVDLNCQKLADAFLNHFGRTTDESLVNFIQSVVVLISTPSQAIITTTMEILNNLFRNSSAEVRLALVKANLIPQLIITLNPLSLSRADSQEFHVNLLTVISHSVWLAFPNTLAQLRIEDGNGPQTVHETILKQVLVPSEKYICHLCANLFSIVDGQLSTHFLELLTQLLQICLYYQPTMEIVLHMPVVLTIPCCLTFIDNDYSIWLFLSEINSIQRDWNETRRDQHQMWKIVHRLLRMEGIEDVIEAKLRNDRNRYTGACIVDSSIKWNNLLGMNLPRRG